MLAKQPDRLHKQECIKLCPNPKSANGPVCSIWPISAGGADVSLTAYNIHIHVHAAKMFELKV